MNKMISLQCEREGTSGRLISGLVTTGYLRRLFRRSLLTIANWREQHGLPYIRVRGGRDTCLYLLDEVLTWAEENGKPVYLSDVQDSLTVNDENDDELDCRISSRAE